MSVLIIMPDEEAERRHYNIANVTKRHCRIGKVSPKPPKHWADKLPKMNPPHWPHPFFVEHGLNGFAPLS